MQNAKSKKSNIRKGFSGIFLVRGFYEMIVTSFVVNIVPISYLIWLGEQYHAFEIGLILAALFWSVSITGLFLGKMVDKYSRKKIILGSYLIKVILLIILALIPMVRVI